MSEVRFTREFIRSTKKEDIEAIREACEEIAADPYRARGSHLLSHDWSGFRAANYQQGKRIIYRVCEECIRLKMDQTGQFECCKNAEGPRDFLTFVDFGDYHASTGRRRVQRSGTYRFDEPDGDETGLNQEN